MTPDLDGVGALAEQHGLAVFGAFHPADSDAVPGDTGTLVLLGPLEPGFWDLLAASGEYSDGTPDPLDRWSERVVGGLAAALGARALYPFGGPPYMPFQRWAAASGRAWVSPVGLLVHDTAGLMVSYRGALAFHERFDLPAMPPCPCETCEGKPCLSACPVGALTHKGYDLPACHGYLDTSAGRDCMDRGCAVRRACPVSQTHGRAPAQSAFHMRAFHR